MSHNPPDVSTVIQPPQSDQPPSDTDSGGSSLPPQTVGDGLQSVSAVSDIIGLTDEVAKAYEGFDPTVHAVGPDGKPKMRKGGNGYQLKRGRKPTDPSKPTETRTSTVRAASSSSEDVRISNDQAALMLCGMVVGGMQTLLGPEWEVTDKAEKAGLVETTRAYLDATGGLDMSPSMGLLFSWGPYALQRLPQPETQSRLQRFGAWCVGLVKRDRRG